MCSFKSNSCHLLQHFKRNHECKISESGNFTFDMQNSLKHVVYIKDDNMLFMTIYIKEAYAYVLNTMITPKNDDYVLCNLTFFKNDTFFKIQTPKFPITDVNIKEQSVFNSLKGQSVGGEVYSLHKFCFRFNLNHLKMYFEDSCLCKIEMLGNMYDPEDNEIMFLQGVEPIRRSTAVTFDNASQECRIATNSTVPNNTNTSRRPLSIYLQEHPAQVHNARQDASVNEQQNDCCCIL